MQTSTKTSAASLHPPSRLRRFQRRAKRHGGHGGQAGTCLAREHGADDEARSIFIFLAEEESLQVNA